MSAWLRGVNGKGIANKVRVAVTGMATIQRIEAIDTGVTNAAKFSWDLEDQEAFHSKPTDPMILVEYEDDNGLLYEQRGSLSVDQVSASEFTYSGEGLGAPKGIARFTIPW